MIEEKELIGIVFVFQGMANTRRLIQPFFQGYINKSTVEDNVLDGAIFSVSPRAGHVSGCLNRSLFGLDKERHINQ